MTAWQDFHRIVNFELFAIADTPVTVASIAAFVLVLIIGSVLSRSAQRLVSAAARRRGLGDEGSVSAVNRLIHYAILLVAIAIAVQILGIRLSALFAAGAVVAVGIGFAMQTIAQNFVSGVILLIERTIKPGDVLELDGAVVRVSQMGIRSTIVRTLFDEEMIVPNSNLVQSTVKNYTLTDRVVRLRAAVGVSYDSDLDVVMAALQRAGESLDGRAEREPLVLLTGFGDSSVDFELSVWIPDPWSIFRMRSALLLAMWRELHEVGQVIAYPQLDVHFDGRVHDALERSAA